MNELRQHWLDLLAGWSADPVEANQAYDDLARRYGEAGRFYHTLEHVAAVLDGVEALAAHAANPNTVRLAAWLHDAVYDTRAQDNEERSADLAVALCERLHVPVGAAVHALILRTKTHAADDDPDAQVLLDADLAVLGASPSVYAAYAAAIRREYAWVPEDRYREGRRRVLSQFLSRPRLFHFLIEREAPARRNLAAEIASLSAPS